MCFPFSWLHGVPNLAVGKEAGSYKSVVDKENQIIYSTWQGRKLVTVALNRYGCEPLQSVTAGKGKAKKVVQKPTCVVKYNQNMGGWTNWTFICQSTDQKSALFLGTQCQIGSCLEIRGEPCHPRYD